MCRRKVWYLDDAHAADNACQLERDVQDPTREGTCPIASGECLRRLAGKVLMHHPAAQKFTQVGMPGQFNGVVCIWRKDLLLE